MNKQHTFLASVILMASLMAATPPLSKPGKPLPRPTRPTATERSPAERSPAERSPAERSPAERSPAERSPAERSPARPAPKPAVPKTPYIDRQNMNLAVEPGDDFYQYANGEWLKKNPVPASKTSWGSGMILYEKSLDAMKTLLEDAAKNPGQGRLHQMVGDFYASGMDSVMIDRKGFDPIKADLARIERVQNKADLMNEIAWQRSQGSTMFFFAVCGAG